MSYEANTGLNVHNQYGPRDTGGTSGVTRTAGVKNEYMKNLDGDSLDFGFYPVTESQGSVFVTSVDVSQVTGTVTAVTIGGVDVTDLINNDNYEAPVEITEDNTRELVVTGATGGKILIEFNSYPL